MVDNNKKSGENVKRVKSSDWTNDKKSLKYFNILKGCVIFIIVYTLLFFCLLLISDNGSFLANMLLLGVVLFVGIFLFLIIYGYKVGKEYNANLVKSDSGKKFKYLDTFYYSIFDISRDSTSFYGFHIIQDISTQKIYAIATQSTGMKIDGNFNNCEGTYWIDKEIDNCYFNDGNHITITYFGKKHELKLGNSDRKFESNGELYILNGNCDISILDKATFITGYAQIDNE